MSLHPHNPPHFPLCHFIITAEQDLEAKGMSTLVKLHRFELGLFNFFFHLFIHSFIPSFVLSIVFCSFLGVRLRFQIRSVKASVSALSTLLVIVCNGAEGGKGGVCGDVVRPCPGCNFVPLKTEWGPEERSASFWEVNVSFSIFSCSLYPFKIGVKVFTWTFNRSRPGERSRKVQCR